MSVRDMLMAAAGVDTGGGSDDNFENVTLLLNGDGTNGAQNNTFVDSSSNNFSITRNGNTTQGSFSPYGSNWGVYFDGAGDYLSVPYNSALDFGTGDFVVEAFVLPTTTSQVMFILASDGTNGYVFGTQVDGGYRGFFIGRNGVGPEVATSGANYWNINEWTHVVFTRSGSTVKIFVNGVEALSTTYSTSLTSASSASLIGSGFSGDFSKGYISNVRIRKGVSVSSVSVPTSPLTSISSTSLLTCQSNRFIDNSSNNFTITVNGNTSVQRFSPFNPTASYSTATIGGSGYFDGSGDYLNIGANAAFSLSGDFTIEGWVYPTGLTNELDMLCLGNQGSGGLLLYVQTSTQKWRLYSSGELILSSTTVKNNQWYHVALVRSGSTITMYVNGSSVGTTTNSSTFTGTSGSGLVVGGAYDGSTYTATAASTYITDVRIVKSAVYTTTFTPPTSPLTAISNTVALTNMTNAGIPDYAMMNDLETVGNAQVSTSVKKFGTGSLAFDGTGDYLTMPDSPNLNIGTGDFTIECWCYFNSLDGSNANPIVAKTNANTTGYLLGISSGGVWQWGSGGDYLIRSSSGPSTSTWYHLAVARVSGTTTMYVNGTSVGTSSTSRNFDSSYAATVGYSPGFVYLNGYIDDLRITKGYARYTANFTPPTAALPVK